MLSRSLISLSVMLSGSLLAATQASAATAAPEAEKAGLPQFDPAVFVPQIIWLVITFGIFYFVMSRVVLPRIGDVLEDREERIADDLDQAQQLSEEATGLQDSFEGSLSEARASSMKMIADARASAQAQIDAKAADLETKLAAQADEAEARIAAEKSAALSELETVATDVCSDIIDKLLGSKANNAAVKKAVKAQIKQRGA